jgi:hypothetical protein
MVMNKFILKIAGLAALLALGLAQDAPATETSRMRPSRNGRICRCQAS